MFKTGLMLGAYFFLATTGAAFAGPDGVVLKGDLRITGSGTGLVFPDGSIQYKAAVQGPEGAQGPAGMQGPAGPQGVKGDAGQAGQVTLESICAAISAAGRELPAFCVASNQLIGSWYGTNLGPAKSTAVLTFVDNSNFYFVEDGSSVLDPSGRDGIERGTYTKSATSFTAVASVNTNGEWGVSGSAIPYSISNNLLTMGSNPDTATFAKIVSNPDNPLIGSWYGTNLGQAKSSAVLTFVDNSTFLFAEDGSSALDPSGQDGMERGTYSRTATTWMPVVSVNTNGEWGFSGTSAVAYAISNNVLTLTVGPDTVSFTRVQ